MAMLVPSLVMMRHLMLSAPEEVKYFTGWPSTSRILSPGRKPAFQAGPLPHHQPMTVGADLVARLHPTPQT